MWLVEAQRTESPSPSDFTVHVTQDNNTVLALPASGRPNVTTHHCITFTLSWPAEATGPQQSGTRPFCVITLIFPLRHLPSEQRPALVRSQVLWFTTYWALEDLLCLEELFQKCALFWTLHCFEILWFNRPLLYVLSFFYSLCRPVYSYITVYFIVAVTCLLWRTPHWKHIHLSSSLTQDAVCLTSKPEAGAY